MCEPFSMSPGSTLFMCSLLNSAHFEYEACLFNREHMKRVDPGDMLKGSHIRIFYFSLYSALFNDVYFFYILPPTAFLLLLFFSFLFFLFFSIIFQQCVFSLSFLKRFSFLIQFSYFPFLFCFFLRINCGRKWKGFDLFVAQFNTQVIKESNYGLKFMFYVFHPWVLPCITRTE